MAATPGPLIGSSPGSSWAPGAMVGRYLLVAPIAQGGMAEIWLARQTGVQGFEKVVVVKRMLRALESPEHLEMFLSEARLAAQLNHHHVVQIFELGEEGGDYYIAMEYLDGENLSAVRRTANKVERPMSNVLYARLIAGAAEGLHYAHGRGIVHRDVSPQNLIVTYDGGIKVVDFGIAKVATQATVSGGLKGKLAYMSPEQARGEPVDARSDVFSLGIVLFELATGTRLLPKMDDLQILHFIGGTRPFPEPLERADVPRQLEVIILKAMARRREDRFQTAREMQTALEDDFIRTSAESASSADIADSMQGLFADRIRERHAIIEMAMNADLAPSAAARSIQGLRHVEEGESATRRPRKQRRRWALPALVGGVAVAVAMLLGAGWALTRPAAPAVLIVDTAPPGASLSVDGAPRGTAPLNVETTPGRHHVTATLDGHQPTTREVELHRGGERLQLVLALLPNPPPVAAAPPVEPVGPPVEPAQPVEPPARPITAKLPKGKLSLDTNPWSTVYLGRTELGNTPLLSLPLPAGRHTLRLVNPEANLSRFVEVEIVPNRTTVTKLRL